MIEKIGHVRNPLSVIAIFAGLAELSGTVVLPFLDPSTQRTYVWFLMFFPILLVGLFFGVLWWKHWVLYAPSDFKNEKDFQDLFRPSSTTAKTTLTLDPSEADEVAPDPAPKNTASTSESAFSADTNTETSDSLIRNFRGTALLAEDLVIQKFAKDLGIGFRRNVALRSYPKVIFDAISVDEPPVILEIVFTRAGRLAKDKLEGFVENVRQFYETAPVNLKHNVRFIFAIVTDRDAKMVEIEKTISAFNSRITSSKFPIQAVAFQLQDLERESKI